MPRMHPVFWHILSHALIYIDIYLQECFQPSSVHLCKSTLCFNCVKQPFYHQYNYTFYSMLICTCNTTKTMLSAYMHVWHAVRRVNGWLFHLSLSWDSHFCKWWVIQIFLSGSSISDWGKRSARMCSDSEKNMSAFADQNHAPSLTCVRLECVNTENEASCQGKRLSKRPSFCASGNDLFFRRGNERDENDVKRG